MIQAPSTPAHEQTSCRYEVFRGIREADLAAWNSLRRDDGDPFMDPCFLEAVETGMAADSKFWHVVFYDDEGGPAATATLCSYRVDAALLANGLVKRMAQAVGRLFPRLLTFRVMFCGLCFSAGQSHLRFAPGANAAAILRELDTLLMSLGRDERAKCIVFKEFRPEELASLESLPGLGYRQAESLPMNHVEPRFTSFDDFCSHQKSNRRYVIQKSRKKFAASGLRVEQMPGGPRAAAIFTDDVYRLFESVFDRAKVRLEKITAETFRELARRLPDQTAWTFIFDGERVVAFAASLFTAATYHQMFVGYDTAINAHSDLYFNLFFHAMDRAYRQHAAVIHVGQSADEFKRQKLNCHQRPLYFYIKGIDRATKVVLKWFGSSLFAPRWNPPDQPAEAERHHVAAGD